MNSAQMRERCPEAAFASIGLVRDWQFRINTRGVSTIVSTADSIVFGAIWLISPSDERGLDDYEGVGLGIYRKEAIEVHVAGRPSFGALVYVANELHAGTARPGYLEGVIAAAIAHGLPNDYVQELKTWSTISV